MSEVAIELVERFPGVADYRRLRAATECVRTLIAAAHAAMKRTTA